MQNTQNYFTKISEVPDQDLTMTIKQQQAIEQILQQTHHPISGHISYNANMPSNFNKNRSALHPTKQFYAQNLPSIRFAIPQSDFDVHKDIQALLKQSEESIGKKFQKMRGEQFKRNRIGLQINDEDGRLKQIFQRMDALSQFSQENEFDEQRNELQATNKTAFEKNSLNKQMKGTQEQFQYQNSDQKMEKQFQIAFDLNLNQLKMNVYDTQLSEEEQLTFNGDLNKSKLEGSSDQQKDNGQKLPEEFEHEKKRVEFGKYPLDQFQHDHILKQKQRSEKILQLDQKYPKINVSSMYKHEYPIFKFSKSSTMKYLKYIKRLPSEVKCAVSFYVKNYFKWTILAIEGILYVFVGQDWKQPVIVNPQRNISNASNYKSIKSLSVSKNNNHLAVSLGSQIILYQIKKQTSQLVLVKNLSSNNELKANLIDVNKLIIYSQKQNPIELVYLDSYKNVGIIKSQQIVFLTRVTQKNISHGLNQVIDFDVFSRNNKFPTYVCMASKTLLTIFKVQPSIQLIHISNLHWDNVQQMSIRWRYQTDIQTKPQLLISYCSKIYIYKLIEAEDPIKNSKDTYLQLHLVYQNHYDIKQMEIISNTHLLLHSNQNIIVVAMPLIPSTDLTQEIQHQNKPIQAEPAVSPRQNSQSASNLDLFQSALVYITSQKGYNILYSSQEEILFYSKNNEQLQVAVLRSLPQYLDQLMIQEGHFREAFTLLILIYKGINCSFKFSYSPESLAQCIYSAVQCTIGSLILSMNDNIIEYRLSWICQLLVETHNENMIWSTVYKKLLQKQKQREKQWENMMFKNTEKEQQKQKNNKFGRESLFQDLMQATNQPQKPKHILTKNLSGRAQNQTKPINKFFNHHLSLKSEQTTSIQLLGKPPKNLEYVLYDILEVFVLKSFITSMPEEIFFDFVAYQCQKKFDIVVQKIITQNKRPYDGPTLLNLLQNEERSYLQLFLFSRAIICQDYDFYTPLMKVLSCYKKYYLIISSGNEDEKTEGVKQKYNNSGMICLWYIAKCLKFQRLPTGLMTLEQKQIIVQSMCVQLLYPTITIKMLDFNLKMFLQTYLLMFIETQISTMIEQQNEYLVSMYKKMYPTQYQEIMSIPPQQLPSQFEKNQTNLQIFDKSFKQLAVLHLERTIPLLKKQKLLWAQFKALTFYYNKNQIDFGFETVVDILIIFFENKFNEYNLYVPSSYQQKKVKARPTLEELELRLIDYIKPILVQKKDRFYINKLLNFNDRNISYYLYRVDQNYRLALEHYINAKQSNNLIPFIYQLLDDIKEISDQSTREKKFTDMKQFLVKNITLLFNIDKFQALEIFYQVGETTQTIHTLIEQNMGNKLNFLTAVLKKSEHQDFYLKQKYLLEHLSQVCMLKQKQMLIYLDLFYYPLDQAIIVCEQKGNLLAKAIFQERCGRLTDAFMSYQKLLRNIIQSNTNNSLHKKNPQKKIKRNVHKYTQQCLRLCKQCAYDPNSGAENNFWLRIITFINGFIKSNSQHKVFLKVQFEKVLQHILTEMFKFLPTTLLIDFFITRGHKLELSLTKQFSIFQKLFTLIKFQIEMVRKSLEISKIDVKSTRKQQMQKRKNGIACLGVCDFCKKLLCDEPSCSIYSCRHSFHKLCHEDIYKCLTCYFQSDNSIFRSNIFGTQLQKLLPQISLSGEKQKKVKKAQNMNIIIQSSEVVKKQSIKKKLKLFDYNNESYGTTFYDNISLYSEKQQSPEQMTYYKNQYIGYDKQKEQFRI